MKKYLLILFLFSLLRCISQPPVKFYNKYGGFGIDIGYGIKETFDRQYIIAGTTSSFGNGGLDAYLILIDSMGQLKWAKSYGGVLTDVAKSILVNPVDSGFIFTGHTNSIGNGGYDVYLMRTDKNGNVIWQRSFGGIDWDFGNDLTFLPDGNIIICGYTYSSGHGKSDGLLLKINSSNGNLIWQKNFGGIEDDDFRSVKITTDNTVILTGKTSSYNDLLGDIYFLKTDLNGDSLTSKTYGLTNKVDFGNDIVDENGINYFITGGSESFSSGKLDAFIMKTNNQGLSEWTRNYGSADLDQESKKVLLSKNNVGNYLITHNEIEFAAYKRDVKTLFLNSGGFYIKGGSFGGFEDEEFYGLSNTSDKGFIGVGYTKSYGSILEDVYVIKYDSLLDIAGNVIGIKETENKKPPINVYPSIINNSSHFVHIDSKEKFSFSIFDTNSKLISHDEFLNNKTDINFQLIPTGLYILSIRTETAIYKYKIIKQ